MSEGVKTITVPKMIIIIVIIISTLEGSMEVYWADCPRMCSILLFERKELERMV